MTDFVFLAHFIYGKRGLIYVVEIAPAPTGSTGIHLLSFSVKSVCFWNDFCIKLLERDFQRSDVQDLRWINQKAL